MIELLEKSFDMVQRFSCNAAYEVRTPLAVMRGEIKELLRDDRYSAEVECIGERS